MYVARILFPVQVLGPGNRVGIWFCGCPHRCRGCSNPELWEFQDRYKTSVETILHLIKLIDDTYDIDGFTITGGEPFYQYDDLAHLLSELVLINDDILVYSGYRYDELADKDLSNISVLIDGRYVEEQNNNCFLRGSSNQRIHILNDKFSNMYQQYIQQGENKIQNFTATDGVISVGIHKPNFSSDFDSLMRKRTD